MKELIILMLLVSCNPASDKKMSVQSVEDNQAKEKEAEAEAEVTEEVKKVEGPPLSVKYYQIYRGRYPVESFIGPGFLIIEKSPKQIHLIYYIANASDGSTGFEITLEPEEYYHKIVAYKNLTPKCPSPTWTEKQDDYMNRLTASNNFHGYGLSETTREEVFKDLKLASCK